MTGAARFGLLSLGCVLLGCPSELPQSGDRDGDGFSVSEGDCDDDDRTVFPGAFEVCDGLDNDCNGVRDDLDDLDRDGVSTCGDDGEPGTADDDCDDTDASIYPNAAEVCDGIDNDCSGRADDAEGIDEDQDGHCVEEGDCDDRDDDAYPGADDVCDGVDNDCNGIVDDSYDGDGDGYSPCGTTSTADCDDEDPAIHPGATEVCNGRDDDCDGDFDEDFDVDGDGFSSCGGDCDDGNADAYPGAAEQCNGVDDDCDGSVDEEVDEDGDGVTPCGGDCDDADAGVYPGSVDGPDGVDNDCDGVVDGFYAWDLDAGELPVALLGAANARHGLSLGGIADVDGDGVGDVLIGAPFDDGNAPDSGSAQLVAGETGDWFASPPTLAVAHDVDGVEEDEQLGGATAVGDLDGDGWADLAIGAPYLWHNSSPVGEVHVFFGGPGAISATPTTDDADVSLRGGFPGEQAGSGLAAGGDVDGDGADDLLIGAPTNNAAPNVPGIVYLFFGRVSWNGLTLTTDADVTLTPTAADLQMGEAVAIVPDMDGDGRDEVLIGSPDADGGDGRAYLVLGDGGSWPATVSLNSADATFHGASGDGWGARVGGVADLDGDGRGEAWIGSLSHGGGGAVALLFGAAWSGTVDLPADADVLFAGSAGEEAGVLAAAGDLDGDGAADVAIGARSCAAAAPEAGALYVVPGPAAGWSATEALSGAPVRLVGEAAGDWFGHAVVAGDLDDDGLDDLVVSAPYNDENGSQAGKVYVVYGY